MSLATSIHITTPYVGRFHEDVFMKARQIIGIPPEHPFKVHDEGLGWDNGQWIGSTPGGFRSALDVTHAHGDLLVSGCDEWCDQPCTYHPGRPIAYIDVQLDTAYGYKVDGQSCNDVHDEIVMKLGAWLDELGVDWWAENEYDGVWHHRSAPYGGVASR